MSFTPRYVGDSDSGRLVFSICSLVHDSDSYDRLLASFARLGFDDGNSEFLAADNRATNQFDGFSWQKRLLAEARGRFVIFSHDDIELIDDGFSTLLDWTDWLDGHDPNWLLAGIAGGVWHKDTSPKPAVALRVSDRYGLNRRMGELPVRVESLDECFMMMRRTRPVVGSYDLEGFHFYGPDLCLQAEILGGTAYAIDFHIHHSGHGSRGKPYRKSRRMFCEKYRKYFPARHLNTVTGLIRLGSDDDPSGA